MPVYSLYSFHRTFIPAFEYLTPSSALMPVYALFTKLLSPVSSTCPQEQNSPSNMVLLILRHLETTDRQYRTLHSNMVLLILCSIFVLIVSMAPLHSNMVLLIQCTRVNIIRINSFFTFQYGSINTTIRTLRIVHMIELYIPIWFY